MVARQHRFCIPRRRWSHWSRWDTYVSRHNKAPCPQGHSLPFLQIRALPPFQSVVCPFCQFCFFYWNTKFSELAPRPRAYQSLERRRTRGIQSYRYRVWPELHPLRKSKRFNKLSTEKHHLAVLIQVKWSYPDVFFFSGLLGTTTAASNHPPPPAASNGSRQHPPDVIIVIILPLHFRRLACSAHCCRKVIILTW